MPRRMIKSTLLGLMLTTAFLVQFTVPLTRIGITYKAIELGLEGVQAGLLAVAFSLFPAVLVIWFGRLGDRGAIAPIMVTGAAIVFATVGLFLWLPPSLPMLFVGTAILGVGQTLHFSGLQLVVILCSTRPHRDAMLGNYLLASSLGGAVAPLCVGLAGTNDPALIGDRLFLLAAVAGALLLASALLLAGRIPRVDRPRAAPMSLGDILATPGLPLVLIAGSVLATIYDLMVIYIPVMGIERAIDLAVVGLMLSTVSLASVASRAAFGRLVRRLGRRNLMTGAAVLGAASLGLLALPLPVWATFPALALLGFCVGTAGTATLAIAIAIAPSGARSTTIAIRQMGTRIGQLVLPLGFGALGAAFGFGVIFATMGLAMLVSCAAAHRRLAA